MMVSMERMIGRKILDDCESCLCVGKSGESRRTVAMGPMSTKIAFYFLPIATSSFLQTDELLSSQYKRSTSIRNIIYTLSVFS